MSFALATGLHHSFYVMLFFIRPRVDGPASRPREPRVVRAHARELRAHTTLDSVRHSSCHLLSLSLYCHSSGH